MPQNEISDYNETDASNVDITGIDVQENVMRAPAVNNAFRALQGALKRWFKASLFRLRDSTDQTKLLAFDLSGITTATTRTITAPNADLDLSGWATGQIRFPATQVPSSNANTLDDYEEGTFTPAVQGSSTAGSGTYSTQTGKYTKIGNVVFFSYFVVYTGHTGTGNIVLTGMPFVAATSTAVSVWVSSLTFSGQVVGFVSETATTILPYSASTGASSSQIAMDAAASILVSGHYFV